MSNYSQIVEAWREWRIMERYHADLNDAWHAGGCVDDQLLGRASRALNAACAAWGRCEELLNRAICNEAGAQ